MADINFQLGDGKPESKVGNVASRVFLVLFATPFAGFGLLAIGGGIGKVREGKFREGIFICLFGLVFAAVGLGLMYVALTAARRQKTGEEKWAAQTDGGKKPWLARPDWAAGKIQSSSASQWKIFLLMGVMFSAIGGSASFFAIKNELPKGNYAALLALLFPIVGIGFLIAVGRGIFSRRRFGDCAFELAQVPAPLGGSLDGLIQTEMPLKLEQGLHLKLSCIGRTVSGSGKNRQVHEQILWQDEKVFRADASLPSIGSHGSGIPVHFQLPANQPESSLRGEATIIWRLEARTKMSGPDFSAMFEVPVFRVAEMPMSAPENDSDPTVTLQMSAEEIRRDEHSKIQVTIGPGGREFYFPAARNVGMAITMSVFFLAAAGGLAALLINHVSWFAAGVVGLIALFLGWACVNLWFKSSRVTIDSTGVTLWNSWMLFAKTRRFAASEIVRFDIKVGMTSGTKAFYDIKLVTPASADTFERRKARYQQTGQMPPLKFGIHEPSGITLASGIASKPETDWLVREMSAALGKK